MKELILSIFIGVILLACDAKRGGYQISGHVEGAGNGQAILLTDGIGIDTVALENGKFLFSGQLPGPTFVAVQVCPEKEKSAVIGFIAENSPIRVVGKWENVKTQYQYRWIDDVTVTGSLNNQVYEEMLGIRRQLLKAPEFEMYAKLQEKYLELQKVADTASYNKLKRETVKLEEEFETAVKQRQMEVIRKNKSVESVAAGLRFFWNDMSLDELKQIYQILDPNVQNSPMAAELREELAIRESVKPGMPAPDFSLETPDGSRLSLSDLRGKYVVLDFWASWCRPCRASFPEMKNIYAQYKDKGLEILGVTNDSRKEDWLKALEQDQLPWKQVIDEFPIEHKPAKVATMYAIPYLPTLILIGPDGKIIGQAKDKHQLVEWLEERL